MEATPTDSTPVVTGPGEASSKVKQLRIPSVHATSYRKATDTTRNIVTARDNRKCWLCNIELASMLEVAHNVSAGISFERLENWKRLGILPQLFYPAQAENLILLCKNCHGAYDCDYPNWILLPHNLDFFINFEKKDYTARVAAAKRGVQQGRALPQIDGTGVICQPYALEPSFVSSTIADWNHFPKHFLGFPQTLVLKATAGCFSPVERIQKLDTHGNVVHTGVPPTVAEKVLKLIILWSRSDPQVVTGHSGQKRQRESQDDDGQDDEMYEKDNREDPKGKNSKNSLNSRTTKNWPPRGTGRDSRNSAESKNKCTNAKQRPTTYEVPTTPKSLRTISQLPHHDEQAGHSNNGTVDSTTESPCESLDGNEMVDKDERFVLGPEKTAAEIMSMAAGWRRAWEMDEAAWKARVQNKIRNAKGADFGSALQRI